MRSPLQTLGGIAQLRAYQDDNENRRLMNEQRRRQLDDDDAIRSTLQRYQRPDDAIDDLYGQGRASAAGALSKQVFADRKDKADALKQKLDADSTKLKLASQIAQGITDDNTLVSGKKAIAALLGPELAAQLGDTYNADTIKAAVAWGTERGDFLRMQNDAVTHAQKAFELGLAPAPDGKTWSENKLKRDAFMRKSAASLLASARKPEEWDGFMQLLDSSGTSKETLAQFGQWDAEAPARALKIGMDPDQQATAANQQATRTETSRHNRAIESTAQGQLGVAKENVRLRGDELAAGVGRGGTTPITGTQRSAVTTRRNKANEDYEEELKNLYPELNEKGKPTGSGKIQIPESAAPVVAQRKLQIEDDYRTELGQPPLLEAEFNLFTKGDADEELAKIRHTYRRLTGQKTPLEEMTSLASEMKRTKDPKKQAELRAKYTELRSRYQELIGRDPVGR